ncbi:MAG: hypothetical protein V9H69_00590 [Anaerolineae bacterium]
MENDGVALKVWLVGLNSHTSALSWAMFCDDLAVQVTPTYSLPSLKPRPPGTASLETAQLLGIVTGGAAKVVIGQLAGLGSMGS